MSRKEIVQLALKQNDYSELTREELELICESYADIIDGFESSVMSAMRFVVDDARSMLLPELERLWQCQDVK